MNIEMFKTRDQLANQLIGYLAAIHNNLHEEKRYVKTKPKLIVEFLSYLILYAQKHETVCFDDHENS